MDHLRSKSYRPIRPLERNLFAAASSREGHQPTEPPPPRQSKPLTLPTHVRVQWRNKGRILVRSFPGVFAMVHWIAFDDDTAEALVSRMRRGAAEIQHNTPVDAALHVDGASVMVLPSSTPGRLLIARFSPRKDAHSQTRPAPKIPVRSVPAAAISRPSQKKPWWRSIVA